MGLPPLIEALRSRPGMFVNPQTLDVITAFLRGYDAALYGGLLIGFREWLIVRSDGGNNLAWEALARDLLGKNLLGDEMKAIEMLFGLLEEFTNARDMPDGLRRIYMNYERWLREQEWYTPQSPQWIAFDISRAGHE